MEGSRLEEVRIFKMVEGQLVHKKTLSKKVVVRRHWKRFGINPVTKKKNKPKKKQVSRHVPVPKVRIRCNECKEYFMGAASRKYCQNPCKHVDKRRAKPPMARCRMCKEMFQPKRAKVNFCHDPCRYVDWIKLNRGKKEN